MTISLQERKMEFTHNLLLEAACQLTEELDVNDISFKKVAERANVSERTMFRYFATRDVFLDALTQLLHQQLNLPAVPKSVAEMPAYIEELYSKLDAQPRKVSTLLQSELLHRVISSTAKDRLRDLTLLLSNTFPGAPKQEVLKTAANIRYSLSASSWRYYRQYFEFDLKTSIDCVQMLVDQAIQHLIKINSDATEI
ncbi:TetR/AcrR family transcriptional regulator [Aliiglaciecola lipolytica]|uniref:HTH tetR-type domain-containing protein n=1 Tax=Aliiglaciecola lipolytica E3 TaxID=1127673 RepID=K6Y4T6_9ALTE|nr:TetR/AcrR family transcriptional regulator [Aliiglaciecola lipolytica]GAC13257.1 hypothetical protein GLIP_0611 [Aliiglaciecola lipolytica E3]